MSAMQRSQPEHVPGVFVCYGSFRLGILDALELVHVRHVVGIIRSEHHTVAAGHGEQQTERLCAEEQAVEPEIAP